MFLRLGPHRKEISIAVLIPNLLTTLALCCGFAAIHFAMKDPPIREDVHWPNLAKAIAAVLFAAIFDALDGRAARYFHVSSPFGAVLDSLSDFLSFGVAPAIILHQWLLAQQGALGIAAATTYALCAALRLARFTAQEPKHDAKPAKPERPGLFFTGMPTPAAAGCALMPPMLATSDLKWTAPGWAVVAFTFLIALIMISRLPMFSLKRLRISRRGVAPLLVCVGLLVVFFARDPMLTLAALAAIYLLLTPIAIVMSSRQKAREHSGAPVAEDGVPR